MPETNNWLLPSSIRRLYPIAFCTNCVANNDMSTDIDEECDRVRKLTRDNAQLHTLCVDAFSSVVDIHSNLETPQQLQKCINLICEVALAPSFGISKDESEELFLSGMNFATFLSTERDYLQAAIRSIDVSDTEELCPPAISLISR